MNSLFRINVPFQMHCHISTTNYIQKCIESFANNSDAFDSLPIWLVNICYDIIAMLTFRVPNLYFNQKILISCYRVPNRRVGRNKRAGGKILKKH